MLEPTLKVLAWVILFNWDSTSSTDNKMAQTTKCWHRQLSVCTDFQAGLAAHAKAMQNPVLQ